MASRWEDVYRYEDNNDGTVVTLEQLVHGEVGTIPGALILNVRTPEGEGQERMDSWASLPFSELRELRDVLTEWLDQGADRG